VPKQATPDGATPDPAVTGKDAGGFRLPLWVKSAPLGYGPIDPRQFDGLTAEQALAKAVGRQ